MEYGMEKLLSPNFDSATAARFTEDQRTAIQQAFSIGVEKTIRGITNRPGMDVDANNHFDSAFHADLKNQLLNHA